MTDCEEERLFDVGDVRPAPKKAARSPLPAQRLWTESKAKLIERYLFGFLMVTKDGSYIDAFAGPQAPDHPETWAANLVLQLRPPWLRHFYFFESNPRSVEALEELRRRHSERQVRVYQGDVNRRIHELLGGDLIGPNEPTFALLDQRTFECDWATVQAIAEHPKAKFKIEQFYFLAGAWMDRAAGGAGEKGRARIEAWYGGSDVDEFLTQRSAQRAATMCSRFQGELAYAYANPYPIYERRGGGRTMYYMIHATDHPNAPALMDAAFKQAVLPPGAGEPLSFDFGQA